MTLWLIVFRSLRQHALSTIVTALSIALAGGLLMSVWVGQGAVAGHFHRRQRGFRRRAGRARLQVATRAQRDFSPGSLARAISRGRII